MPSPQLGGEHVDKQLTQADDVQAPVLLSSVVQFGSRDPTESGLGQGTRRTIQGVMLVQVVLQQDWHITGSLDFLLRPEVVEDIRGSSSIRLHLGIAALVLR